MSSTPPDPSDPLETILRACAAAAPQPWYPRCYVEEHGIPRDSLDPYLQELRLGGWIRLTDWVRDRGQGYVLTEEGRQLLHDPAALEMVKNGYVIEAGTGDAVLTDLGEVYEPAPAFEAPTLDRQARAVREALTGDSRPLVCWTLLLANVAVFLAGLYYWLRAELPLGYYLMGGMFQAPAPRFHGALQQILLQTGAVNLAEVRGGDWWRLLSCCFVHVGLIHLGVNMYMLYMVGPLLERMWGWWRFLLLYLSAGVAGSCVQLMLGPAPLLAGASGAIWGIMASLAVWIVLNRRHLPPGLASTWLRQLWSVFVLNVFISFLPGIGAGAHFGGGAAGAVAAGLLHVQRFGRGPWRGLGLAGALATPLLCVAALTYVRDIPTPLTAWLPRPAEPELFPVVAAEPGGGDAFALQYLAPAGKLEQEVEAEFRRRVLPVLERKPDERGRADVGQALVWLEREQKKLRRAADQLKQAKTPDRAHDVARRMAVQLFEQQALALEQSARCLKAGTDLTDADPLDRQLRQVRRARDLWQRSVQRLK